MKMDDSNKTLVYLTAIAVAISGLGFFISKSSSITGMAYRTTEALVVEGWMAIPFVIGFSLIVIIAVLLIEKILFK